MQLHGLVRFGGSVSSSVQIQPAAGGGTPHARTRLRARRLSDSSGGLDGISRLLNLHYAVRIMVLLLFYKFIFYGSIVRATR